MNILLGREKEREREREQIIIGGKEIGKEEDIEKKGCMRQRSHKSIRKDELLLFSPFVKYFIVFKNFLKNFAKLFENYV